MITKDLIIAEVINKYPDTIPVFQQLGIGCIGCIAGSQETLEQGLAAHGVDVDKAVQQMNDALSA